MKKSEHIPLVFYILTFVFLVHQAKCSAYVKLETRSHLNVKEKNVWIGQVRIFLFCFCLVFVFLICFIIIVFCLVVCFIFIFHVIIITCPVNKFFLPAHCKALNLFQSDTLLMVTPGHHFWSKVIE